MNDEKRTNKRKLLIRYLILAASLFIIASVTVITICAANDWFRVSVSDTIDKGEDKKDELVPPQEDTKNDDEDDDKPTSTDTSWAVPVAGVNVITPYDFVEDVTLKNQWHFHTGLDFAADVGTEVTCCFDGVVESIICDDELEGNKITVEHSNGVKTTYSFIDVNANLKAGDSVKKGAILGTVAQPNGKECMLESHLHFEVIKNGESTNPEEFLDVNLK